ncbi:hypothetical protein EST38_g22 [Candolleomyces aberdarensis]|uniref:Cell division control protein 14 n=1 Tax=Candolleomyces aberdarensis TaxID=2316362 RepID=A0A4Q2DZ97_9AGAR|nr:hypothetical protein EST38_g22 [Candolleomyces aberdarensis]
MEDGLWKLRESLQEALDQIASSRSSLEIRSKAFDTIERHLASALSKQDDNETLDHFLALQYTFECNVPARLLSWITTAAQQLDTFAKGLTTGSDSQPPESHKLELFILTDQITQALSLIQGISLCHTASKDSLGRKYALEVLVDLLMASRHLPTVPNGSDRDPARKLRSSAPPLTSIVLDTLLCILVDSSTALRAFETANGPQAVVRILKRAGTPREVRMKCLEFLYFYLLDETNPTTSTEDPEPEPAPTPPQLPTAPATPIRPTKSFFRSILAVGIRKFNIIILIDVIECLVVNRCELGLLIP